MSLWLAIVVVYGIALFGLSLYSLNHAALVAVFLRRRRSAGARRLALRSDPVVTIQLPLFNELYVAERVIRSACEVDYPRELLEIQVLDDSTDETLELTRRLVRDLQARGVPIVHLHRDNRKGFKSGALAHGFETCAGRIHRCVRCRFRGSARLPSAHNPALCGPTSRDRSDPVDVFQRRLLGVDACNRTRARRTFRRRAVRRAAGPGGS